MISRVILYCVSVFSHCRGQSNYNNQPINQNQNDNNPALSNLLSLWYLFSGNKERNKNRPHSESLKIQNSLKAFFIFLYPSISPPRILWLYRLKWPQRSLNRFKSFCSAYFVLYYKITTFWHDYCFQQPPVKFYC